MKVDLGIWDRLTKLILFLIVMAAGVGVMVWYLPTIQRNERMRKDNLILDREIEKEQELTRQLKAANDSFKDPRTVERLVREKLNYSKAGETVIRFQAPATNTSPTNAPR